tara:strand:- start:5734 stop:6681 length:948 start_codon:yes stop_codon:yes gene_type:complete
MITADDIINGVNRRISNPQPQGLLSNSDILAFCDNIIQAQLIPLLESVDQDYFVDRIEIPLVAGQSNYSVPYRSVARGLREIRYKESPTTVNLRNMPLISIENAYMYTSWQSTIGFHFENDTIRLVPDVPTTLAGNPSLLCWYRLPPNKLVQSTAVAKVTSVVGNVVNVESIPSTLQATTQIDFCQGRSGSSIYAYDIPIAGIVGTTQITFAAAADIPTQLTAGDYISLSGESYVVNWLPNEAFPLLETLTCQRMLQSISDYEGVKMLNEDAQLETQNLLKILEPRIDGESEIIVNYNSLARTNKANQRSWLYGQ